jgi:putative hydrolase of the HAD superfamily
MSGLPPAVIFDLGNVILPFDPLKPCRVLADRTDLEPMQVALRIYKNNLERKFEQGNLTGLEFTRKVGEVLCLALDPNEWRALWSDMFTENEAVSEIVRRLQPNHPLILLSNTNPWHWEYAREKYPILQIFRHRVLSYEVGVLKPHPAIYRAALEHVTDGRRAIFIDDMPINAAGASVMGIAGLVFESAEKLERDLKVHGCRL